ncbi:MAG: TusE/DsrC/DsvC family sulfur relay protein [Thermofilaceae archaeon]
MTLREEVLNYVREYYAANGLPPSIRDIAKNLKVSTRTLYSLFPGGVEQVYETAGLNPQLGKASRYAELFSLYREYLYVKGCEENILTLIEFIESVREFVRARLGASAAERLEKAPLNTFNKVARIYLKKMKRN